MPNRKNSDTLEHIACSCFFEKIHKSITHLEPWLIFDVLNNLGGSHHILLSAFSNLDNDYKPNIKTAKTASSQ